MAARTAISRRRDSDARQQQVGDIHAGDQQHEHDRAQQHQHGAPDALDHFILEAGEHDRVVLVVERDGLPRPSCRWTAARSAVISRLRLRDR